MLQIIKHKTLRIIKWMRVRRLELAPHKTEAVLLTTRRKLSPISFKIQDAAIVPSKAIKLLGVWLDSKLDFAVHVDRTTQKAKRTGNFLLEFRGGGSASPWRVIGDTTLFK